MNRFSMAMIVLLLAPLAAGAADFVPGTEDVPVMAGLRSSMDGMIFDKPQGRIVEVQYHGKLKRRDIEAFYAAALPQLGWQPDAAGAWQREGEMLRLDFSGKDGDIGVDFVLSPR
jgi:hypothetical protein